jgi:glycosyltransferase involved in cell wall biosynthesis
VEAPIWVIGHFPLRAGGSGGLVGLCGGNDLACTIARHLLAGGVLSDFIAADADADADATADATADIVANLRDSHAKDSIWNAVTMTQLLVSAIIPAYNALPYLELAVRSAIGQDYGNLEIIIVDDGSTDGTFQLADQLAARWPDRIRVVHQPNGGLCAARNAGIAEAKGAILALLDSDDEWLPHHISAAAAVFEARPDVGLVHANIEWIDSAGVTDRIIHGRWKPAQLADPWASIFLRLDHVNCPTAVFRRSAIEGEVPFDMRFNRLGCEDRDLWLRVASRQGVVYLDDISARYRRHGANMSKQTARMLTARLALIDKHSESGKGKQLRRRALAATLVESADEYRSTRHFYSAFRMALRAFMLLPLSFRVWKAVAAAALRRA